MRAYNERVALIECLRQIPGREASALEDKAGNRQATASELSVVRCIVEACAADLDGAWERA